MATGPISYDALPAGSVNSSKEPHSPPLASRVRALTRRGLQTHSGAWPLWITPLRASTEGQRSRFSMGPSE